MEIRNTSYKDIIQWIITLVCVGFVEYGVYIHLSNLNRCVDKSEVVDIVNFVSGIKGLLGVIVVLIGGIVGFLTIIWRIRVSNAGFKETEKEKITRWLFLCGLSIGIGVFLWIIPSCFSNLQLLSIL